MFECNIGPETNSSELKTDFSAVSSALLARTGYLASIGELQTDKASVMSKLGESAHGSALVDQLVRFEEAGSKVERVGLMNWKGSPYTWKDLINPFGTAGRIDRHGISYRNNLVDSATAILTHNRDVGPRSVSAYTLAHEAGHLDGTIGNFFFAKGADPKHVAALQIKQETDAIISAVKWQQSVGRAIADGGSFQTELARGTLGSRIKHQWWYPELKHLSEIEADAVANAHIKSVFGNLVDSSGVIKPYSLERVQFINKNGLVEGGKEFATALETSERQFLRPGTLNSSFGRSLGRVAQVAGVISVGYMITDVADGFKKGATEGIREVLRIGANWGGWELGVALALKTRSYRSPVACILGGVIGSIAADKVFDFTNHKIFESEKS